MVWACNQEKISHQNKSIMHEKIEGSRKMERPKRIWSDDIRQRTGLGITEASRRTEDRMRWKMDVPTWVHQQPLQRLWS